MFFKLTTHHEPWGSVDQSKWVWPTHPRSQVPSHRSYHQWLSMGATFVDDPELVPVLSGIHLLTLEGWKTGLVLQPKDIERSVGVTSTENRTWVTRMVAQWFTDYAAAVFKIGGLKKFLNIHRKTPVLVFLFNKFVGNAYLHYKWPSWQGKKQFSTTLT